jgi:hypothetical protein
MIRRLVALPPWRIQVVHSSKLSSPRRANPQLMDGGAPPLEARTKVVITPDGDGGQQAVAGRLFVPADHYRQHYAASRSVAVRISAVLLILRLEYLRYWSVWSMRTVWQVCVPPSAKQLSRQPGRKGRRWSR